MEVSTNASLKLQRWKWRKAFKLRLTSIQLLTILKKIEVKRNSRPLIYLSDDINDQVTITPMHFLESTQRMVYHKLETRMKNMVQITKTNNSVHHKNYWNHGKMKQMHKQDLRIMEKTQLFKSTRKKTIFKRCKDWRYRSNQSLKSKRDLENWRHRWLYYEQLWLRPSS